MTTTFDSRRTERPTPARDRVGATSRRRAVFIAFSAAAVLVVTGWSLSGLALAPSAVASNYPNLIRFLDRAFPVVFPSWSETVQLSATTMSIVICATMFAAIVSVPVALLAATNTSRSRFGVAAGRLIGLVTRASPDIVIALVVASVLGNGPLPGILGLGIHSIGMISKLFADAIEDIDEGPRLALRAAGASRMQEFVSGIFPQVAPSWVATVLHRNDINVRASVLLGFVGVGGLGEALAKALGTLDYARALGIASIMFVLCLATEAVSALARNFMLNSPAKPRRRDRYITTICDVKTLPAADRRPWTTRRLHGYGLACAAIAVVIAAAATAASQPSTSGIDFWKNAQIAWNGMWPPAFSDTGREKILPALVDTVRIALAATVLALVPSVILGALGAANVAPNNAVRRFSRFTLVLIRALPELVLALIFIIMTGLGPTAGALALAIGGVGLLGKLSADTIEDVDRRIERAVSATGAGRLQVFTAATLPQACPTLASHAFYLFDSNLRGAVVLGIVGGGGVGFLLLRAQSDNHHEMTAILLCILALVIAVEALSGWVRKKLT